MNHAGLSGEAEEVWPDCQAGLCPLLPRVEGRKGVKMPVWGAQPLHSPSPPRLTCLESPLSCWGGSHTPSFFSPSGEHFKKLGYNLHSRKGAFLKHTNLVIFSIFTVLCNSFLIPECFHHPRKKPCALQQLAFMSSWPAPGTHESTSCLCGCACSGHFTYMEPHTVWPFVSGFTHWALCFQGPSTM